MSTVKFLLPNDTYNQILLYSSCLVLLTINKISTILKVEIKTAPVLECYKEYDMDQQ